jgi:hypothetical protein
MTTLFYLLFLFIRLFPVSFASITSVPGKGHA